MKYIKNYDYESVNNENEIKNNAYFLETLINDYYLSKKTISNNIYGNVDENISNNLKNNIEYYLEELNLIDTKKLNLDQKIWFDSFKFNLNLEYKNYDLNTRLLGGNPCDMDKCFALTHYNLWVVDNLNDVIDIFDRDSAKNIMFDDNKPLIDKNKLNNLEFKVNSYIEYLSTLQNNLTQGMVTNTIPSRILVRLCARNLLINLYYKELSYFAINKKLTKLIPNEFLTNFTNKYVSYYSDSKYKSLMDKLQVHLDSFINFYIEKYVPYCFKSDLSYGGRDNDLFSFEIDKNNNEVEQTYVFKNESNELFYIYGLGLTNDDLNQKYIGLEAMNSSIVNGKDLYYHFLNICSTTGYDAQKIYEIGMKLTLENYEQMKIIATEVANLLKNPITNTWMPKIKYDIDGNGPLTASDCVCEILNDGNLNLSEFNKWLNQENAFFGREVNFWNDDKISHFTTKNDKNDEINKYISQLESAGYSLWLNQKFVDNKINVVSGPQAFAGAVCSLRDANDFKTKSSEYLKKYFFSVEQDYDILPYDISVQEIWGAGQEGLNMFGFNINPYYSEHKWAFPSFIIHEAIPGHHTQLAYWTKYFKGNKDENGKFVPYFSSTGFHEGWAVFMEWFASKINIYGLDIVNEKIQYYETSNGILNNCNNIELIQNGIYVELAKQNENINFNDEKFINDLAIKLAKLLTYYGFLNAAQLRNIRLVVDTCLHSDIKPLNNDILGLCSLNEVRNFINKYSAIGIGDQMNESKRYLAWPAQATSYMLGKVIMHELFNKICKKYLLENSKPFFDFNNPNNTNTGPLFDLFLRNGEIPLNVLIKYVTLHYGIK